MKNKNKNKNTKTKENSQSKYARKVASNRQMYGLQRKLKGRIGNKTDG